MYLKSGAVDQAMLSLPSNIEHHIYYLLLAFFYADEPENILRQDLQSSNSSANDHTYSPSHFSYVVLAQVNHCSACKNAICGSKITDTLRINVTVLELKFPHAFTLWDAITKSVAIEWA